MSGKTLYDKIWDAHLVTQREDGTALIYIDRHLIHEVTSPQAFEGLRIAGRKPWRADANFATPDHNIPTTSAERRAGIDGILDPISKISDDARRQLQRVRHSRDEHGRHSSGYRSRCWS